MTKYFNRVFGFVAIIVIIIIYIISNNDSLLYGFGLLLGFLWGVLNVAMDSKYTEENAK